MVAAGNLLYEQEGNRNIYEPQFRNFLQETLDRHWALCSERRNEIIYIIFKTHRKNVIWHILNLHIMYHVDRYTQI